MGEEPPSNWESGPSGWARRHRIPLFSIDSIVSGSPSRDLTLLMTFTAEISALLGEI